jgi:hypothetical protein
MSDWLRRQSGFTPGCEACENLAAQDDQQTDLARATVAPLVADHLASHRAPWASTIEHEIQRQMIERLHIPWPPGEPFYALIEDEIVGLRRTLEAARGHLICTCGMRPHHAFCIVAKVQKALRPP